MAVQQPELLLGHLRRLVTVQGYEHLPDRELLRRFAGQRDEGAFETLMRRHGPMVLRVGRRVLHPPQDAEDVFQATFLILARKAGALAWRESIANWLHEVAHRLARAANAAAARRTLHERRVGGRPVADPFAELTLREAQALFDEELNRLPPACRAPLILCYLEGTTQDEAARQLGCSLATCKRRLEQGRNLLRVRLSRRGVSLSAVLLPQSMTESAVPTTLLKATLRAAQHPASAGGLISKEVATLAGGKAVLLGKGQAAALLALLGVAAVGAIALAGRLDSSPQAARPEALVRADTRPSTPQPPSARSTRIEPGMVEEGDRIRVQGCVLDPDGRPLAGAEVTVWWHYGFWILWHPRSGKPPRAFVGGRAGPDGRFRFTFPKAAIDDTSDTALERPWRFAQVVAAAPGYGPAWRSALDIQNAELNLRLARDDIPVHGRVLDLQGRPVAGARLRVAELREGENHVLWQTPWLGLPENPATDRQGRFTLTGLGRGRDFLLEVEGTGIAHQVVPANTRPAESRPPLEIVVGPTKPVVGTVRAKDTGKPLPGVIVYGDEEPHRRGVRAVTDADGHYRLLGLPKAATYLLTAYAPAELGYLGSLTRVAGSEGLKPVTADLALRPGVRVRFRILDEQTGQPVGRSCQYTPLPDNRYKIEAGDRTYPSMEFMHIHTPDRTGLFDFVAFPGPGVLFCFSGWGSTPYLKARLDPADMARGLSPTGSGAGLVGFVNASEAYRLIDPSTTVRELTFDLRVRRGYSLKGKLMGPDGEPVTGAIGYGLTFDAGAAQPPVEVAEQKLATAEFTALGLCGELRTLTFVHKGRKLIGHAVVRGTETGPVTVRLQPWGVLTGRLLDASGKPIAKARVKAWHGQPRPGIWPPDGAGGEVETDAAGRFRLEYLDPTLERDVIVNGGKTVAKGLSVGAGKVKDLGDVRITK